MSSNEVPCTVSVIPKIWALSSLGRKPFGTTAKSTTVAARMTPEKASAAARRCITHARLSSYQPRIRWYTRSDERRAERRRAVLHVAHDVLEHHDGVVHHEPDR